MKNYMSENSPLSWKIICQRTPWGFRTRFSKTVCQWCNVNM